MGIKFYCGIGETRWNYHPVSPGKYVCISPVMGRTEKTRKENRIWIPKDCEVIQDSGAFSDGPIWRLTPEKALERQIYHANKYNYYDQITHIASYDLLIDERWKNGERFKERWQEEDAWVAVQETIINAQWLIDHRPKGKGLVLSAQGVSPSQYCRCVNEIVPLVEENDILGLGGWCITGKMRRRMMPVLSETFSLIFPIIGNYPIKKVHIWGVLLAEALAELLFYADQYKIQVSTDSVGPSIKPALGSWGYADWRIKDYKQPPTSIRGIERERHVRAVIDWLNTFDKDRYRHARR